MSRVALLFCLVYVALAIHIRHPKLFKQDQMKKQASWTAPPKDHWFDQQLDHFDPLGSPTFKQRFWMNETFSNGKSLLLAFGGEAPLQDFYGVSGNILADIAQQHNMLLVYIEHRFYGDSVPSHDSSTKNLRYLTTPQALEDYAYFLYWAKSGGLRLSPDAKVITMGCSYSGMLSGFFRQKYSWLTVGAIAGSAPVNAQLNFEDYTKTVAQVLATAGCDQTVKAGFTQMVQTNQTQGIQALQSLFNTCPQQRPVQLADISSAVSGFVEGAVQGNNPDAGFPVVALCAALKGYISSGATPLQALVSYVRSQQNGQCLDVDSIGDTITPGAGRSWTWQTCVEYGFFQTDDDSKIFGDTLHLQFYQDICKAAFPGWSKFPNTDFVNYQFGGLNQQQASWIIFSNGLQDPWGSNLGINVALGPTLPVTLSTSAHCAAYHQPNKNDPQNLIQSRVDIKKFVAEALQPRFE